MYSRKFFRKLGIDLVKKYKKHIWDTSEDVYSKKFKTYKSKEYADLKNAGKLKRQSAESRGKLSPIVTGDFKNDFKLLKSSSSGFKLGWASHGSKVKWLAKKGRVVTDDKQPLPKKLLRMIDNEVKRETERQLPKDQVIRINIGR